MFNCLKRKITQHSVVTVNRRNSYTIIIDNGYENGGSSFTIPNIDYILDLMEIGFKYNIPRYKKFNELYLHKINARTRVEQKKQLICVLDKSAKICHTSLINQLKKIMR